MILCIGPMVSLSGPLYAIVGLHALQYQCKEGGQTQLAIGLSVTIKRDAARVGLLSLTPLLQPASAARYT